MVRIRAPELSQTFSWLNCQHPLSLKDLRGQVVLLDFWTYGCINCLHVIPDLHYLEQKYSNHLTIVSIHTAKFDYEQNLESIQQAILRYGITHPVLVDRDRTLWDQYAIRAYPTFVVIDPQGYIVATLSGEGRRDVLDELIQQLIQEHAGKGTLNERFLEAVLQPESLRTSPLAFPGKVLADAATDTLLIADTGHDRIVLTTLDGRLKDTIGTGVAGWQDGDWDTAQFSAPQGMALDASRQVLYVADAGNHRLRQVELPQQTVRTIAGTGTQSRLLFPHGGKASDVALNSPWDLGLLEGSLYIAMAGSHQIWRLDLNDRTIQTFVGTGAEGCVDGSVEVAAFAQPYGMASDGTDLFVADSESSTLRAIEQTPTVRTVCGGGHLFVFGDRDGIGSEVQLQHCSGLVYARGFLWVADTYNHKIKRVNPATGECWTVAGSGVAGSQDGVGDNASFSEPSGLTFAGNTLYIADTNNHAIRCLDLESFEVTTLSFPDLCSPFVCVPIDLSS